MAETMFEKKRDCCPSLLGGQGLYLAPFFESAHVGDSIRGEKVSRYLRSVGVFAAFGHIRSLYRNPQYFDNNS